LKKFKFKLKIRLLVVGWVATLRAATSSQAKPFNSFVQATRRGDESLFISGPIQAGARFHSDPDGSDNGETRVQDSQLPVHR